MARLCVGLVADTHIPEAGPELWPQVYDAFEPAVDVILHAGDVYDLASSTSSTRWRRSGWPGATATTARAAGR